MRRRSAGADLRVRFRQSILDCIGIGRRIRRRREQLGMTQTELAKAIGLTNPNTIQNYEINRWLPRVEYLARLAIALQTSTDWILPPPKKRS